MSIKIGNSPESWGVVSPDDPDQTPWHRFLDEVTEAGYECIELGPYGYLPTDPVVLRSELEHRGLRVTAAGLLSPLEDPSAWPNLEASSHRASQPGGRDLTGPGGYLLQEPHALRRVSVGPRHQAGADSGLFAWNIAAR